MNLDDVRKIKIPRQKRHRVGRGRGSGWGTTSGRGNKGAGQRSGTRFRLRFEGGQMPLYRRLPKKGFSNARFKTEFFVVNVGALDRSFAAGATVDVDTLKAVGLAPKRARFVKVLGYGEVTKALDCRVHGASTGAREKIEAAKGSIRLLATGIAQREKGLKKGPQVQASSAGPDEGNEPSA